MAGYEVFHAFYVEEDANSMVNLLSQKGIDCKIERSKPIIDKIIIGDEIEPSFLLKIPGDEFNRAHEIINEEVGESISKLDADYYLFSFSNEELMEIIRKPDEWSDQDFVIAQKILTDRGHSFSQNQIQTIKAERMEELKKPAKEEIWSILLGYFLSIIVCIGGLFYGLFLVTGKKLLPDGTKVFTYEKRARIHGRIIILISITMMALAYFGVVGLFWVLGWFIV